MKITEIIKKRNAARDEFEKRMDKAILDGLSGEMRSTYTEKTLASKLRETLDAISAEERELYISLNAKLKAEVRSLIERVKSNLGILDIASPTDIRTKDAVEMSNALQSISLLGSNITDKSASMILAPFKKDLEKMTLFEEIISSITGSVTLENFNESFGEHFARKEALAKCDELTQIAETIFLHKKLNANGKTFYNEVFCSTYDCYDELADQDTIVEKFAELGGEV